MLITADLAFVAIAALLIAASHLADGLAQYRFLRGGRETHRGTTTLDWLIHHINNYSNGDPSDPERHLHSPIF